MVTENGQSDGNTSFLRAARNGQLDKVLEHLKSNIDINTSNANGLNALHLASKDGHVQIVEELLKRGAVVDAATKKGNTALHIASLAGQEEVVKLLVQHGASVNVQSQNGFTPLYMAAQENHDNVVKYLLANGANQSLSTEDGFTPLAVAMQQGHDKVVTVLLENDTRGKVRLPALHIAAKKDDVKAAKLLLENEHNPDVTSKSGFTPLHIASHYGNQQIANLLIQKGADVNYAAKHNITPLHVAAKWGKTNMVGLLLEHGATIESKTRDGLTPLHCAARSGHENVVDILLEKGAPISSKTKNGLAPLHMAAQGDHLDAARILLYHRAPVDEVTVDYLTALHVAAHCGHVRVAKLLLDRQADANARALNGFTPLHIACKKNRIKVVELLLKHGASIGATTESGLTPLHVASFMGCMNIVIYLLQHDANPDVPTVRGETPLHLAARANQTDIIRILLRNGAQVDARAREQQTPLHIASRLGNVDIVMLLLQHGAKVDNATKDMYTALHIAAKEGQDEVASVLIENGASVNATTKKGFTPLHLAAKYGHLKVAKLLLQKEAPVDSQGKNGVTPLHVASHYDHQNVALLLLDKGASPHATAKNGHTPLHIAARKNQMDIANTLLEYGAQPNAESKAGFTSLHLSAQEGHTDMSALLIENKADTNHQSKNGLTPLHLCAQEDRVPVAEILVKNGADVNSITKAGYTPLHIASHYGQANMVRFLLGNGANVGSTTTLCYTPLHQAAQQGHTNIVNILLENKADADVITTNGQTPLNIAQKLGYITVIETLKVVTSPSKVSAAPTANGDEKYRVVAPEAMHETFMSDSEEEGGEDTVLGDQTYRYLTADEMKSLGDDSLPIDVTRDERIDSNRIASESNIFPPQHIEDTISPEHVSNNYVEYIKKYTPDNVDISRHPVNIGFLVSFLVDARGGAMRGCRHSGVRVIVPPRCAPSPTRITCRYVRPQRTPHPPPLMEGEALASRVLELGPVGAKFLGPVIIEVPHFAALRSKEREIVILRSDNGESWKEHTVEASEDVINDVLHDSFEADDLNQMEDIGSGRITRILTQDFPQYFAVVSRIRQEVHAIGPEGGMVSSTVVPQVQAVFPEGALTKKIKVGLQAQPIDPELTAKLLGHGVAVSPVVTVEPRRRKFHKAITLSMPAPRPHSQGMINQYSGSAPTLRLLCSITGGTTRAQWEDVTGSTPLTFVNDCVSFTTTVSARFWLMDCRNIGDATKMATELYKEAIHVPFMAKFVVFAKRIDPLEARLRVFCMTDDKEDKTLEQQEHFTEVAKSRDVEVLEGKPQFIEFAGNLIPITKSGEQLQFSFRAFRENRLPFSVRVKDQHAEAVGRCLFMREPKVAKGEPPQQPICILNIVLPDDIVSETVSLSDGSDIPRKHTYLSENFDYYRPDPRLADMSNLLGEDWVPLANQLGLTTSEINVIKSEYPDSVAKQAQSMLRMWLSQSSNKAQTNTLENALKRIGREDIIPQCLNIDHTITRRTQPELGKYKPTKYPGESFEEVSQKIEAFDKYSAEEKAVETSDEEDFNKTVTERREQIEKRLSATIPASTQRVEIVQEITTIKQKSLVEDKIAEVEKVALTQPPIKSTPTEPVKPISQVISSKTTSPAEQTITNENVTPSQKTVDVKENIASDTYKTIAGSDGAPQSSIEDKEFLQGVVKRIDDESKAPTKKLIADEVEPKSPKFSKTPPPSPADFFFKDQATINQELEAQKKKIKLPSHDEEVEKFELHEETSKGPLTTEPIMSLTTTKAAPQPKPRSVKTPETLPFTHEIEEIKTDKQISPVRDDLLDSEEQADVLDSYSDRKKFWENVSKDSQQTKRMSLQEIHIDKNILAKKRQSVQESSLPPVPKPRQALYTSQSVTDSTDIETRPDIVTTKERTISFESSTSDSSGLVQTDLTRISESDDTSIHGDKYISEYQACFLPPLEQKPRFKPTETFEKTESVESDVAQKGSSQIIENTGYISDSEDVEHYISDSEIEDRVPQIRERQMSVFAPPVASNRRSIYERSASLPTEDLYQISDRAIKLRKQYYEEQIKKEMIEEQLTSEVEDEPSPERKTLFGISQMKSEEEVQDIQDSEEQFQGTIHRSLSTEKLFEEDAEEEEEENIKDQKRSVKELTKNFEKQLGNVIAGQKIPVMQKSPMDHHSSNDIKDFMEIVSESSLNETKDIEVENITIDSQQSISSDRIADDQLSKPDSMEVHVDKSETEYSEKIAELDQDATDFETKSLDSLNAIEETQRSTYDENIPEITITLSGKQRRISEESDEEIKKEPISKTPLKQSEEHIQDTVWEVSVQSQPEMHFDEVDEIAPKLGRIGKEMMSGSPSGKIQPEREDDLSSSLRDESDLGSEIHQDHSDSLASDKIKSDSFTDIEKIILDSLHQQQVDPDEAKKIASALVGEIESEIQKRESTEPVKVIETISESNKTQMSEYLRHLAETKGLDEREVELVESVLARRQRELARLSRDDTHASSMEITDEDLRYSGTEIDYTNILEQQMDQLKAEKVNDKIDYDKIEQEQANSFDNKTGSVDKIDQKHVKMTSSSEGYESYEDNTPSSFRKETESKTVESVRGEKFLNESKNIIFEEDETISESAIDKHDNITTEITISSQAIAEESSNNLNICEEKTESIEAAVNVESKTSEKINTIVSDKALQENREINESETECFKISEKFGTVSKISQNLDDQRTETQVETQNLFDQQYKEQHQLTQQEKRDFKQDEDGSEVETITSLDMKHSVISSNVTEVDHIQEKVVSVVSSVQEIDSIENLIDNENIEKMLNKPDAEIQIKTHEIIKRTSSSDSKSSLESGKSPEDQFSTCSSEKKDSDKQKNISCENVVLRRMKADGDTSSSSSNLKPDRKSGVDFEAYSSSGESYYHSFELDSNKSRPCSSDVEGMVAAGSSEYESALTSQELSGRSHITSSEYQTAVSSLSSKESMKSLDSESSGNLASIEVSEVSETLVPSTSDLDGDILDTIDQQMLDDIVPHSEWTTQSLPIRQSTEISDSELLSYQGEVNESMDVSEDDLVDNKKGCDVPTKMKRSHEMTFQPEPQILSADSPSQADGQDVEEKFGTSLEDGGSVLSMSVSSTSSLGAVRTVIEVSRADSERHDGSMTISGTSEQLSTEGDFESLPRKDSKSSLERQTSTPIISSSDIATSTTNIPSIVPIDSVTITTSSIKENGIQSVSTQVTSETQSPVEETVSQIKSEVSEIKRKGHRRQESTSSFKPSMIILPSANRPSEIDATYESDLTESDKYTSSKLSFKEVSNDEKKDVDEKEESYETEADQGIHKDYREGRYLEAESDNEFDFSRPQSHVSVSDSDRERCTSTDDRPDSELVDLALRSSVTDDTDPFERPPTPEPCDETKIDTPELSSDAQASVGELEHDYISSKAKDISSTETRFPREVSTEVLIHKELLEKRDSHGKSSTTSSEKSSFEEAEAEAAFNMVAHISPAHKVKQICPILEDEDAEKHELETRERAQKELEERRSQMRDQSPSFIPDIKVTQHMAPIEDRNFHYPELELEAKERESEAQAQTPQTPASNSSKSSEETDQGREYVLEDVVRSIPEESEPIDDKASESKSEVGTVVEKTLKEDSDKETDSPNSDSFEMLEKPDLMDDFVVIEEVAKEAHELDSEGKSVKIHSKPKRVPKKHDEEVEEYLVKSAPTPLTKMTDIKYYPDGSSSDELGFEFEDSPPQDKQKAAASKKDYGQEYDKELEANKKWIEQQFQGDQAAMIAAGYGYEMEFERGPLEDIKEEDVTDLDTGSSRIGSMGSQKNSGGSLGSVKDSYSSTPEYDVLAGRKYFTRSGEHDDISMSSLQEFENLEQAMSLEMKKFHQGSQDSSSNGSFKSRYLASKSGQGDDISVSSLKEFEGLEKACIAAHKIEIKVKEEEAILAQIDEGQESLASESESCETMSSKKQVLESDEEDYEKRMFEIDEIIKQAQTNVERFIDLKEAEKTESLGRGDSIEEVSKVPDLDLDVPVVKSSIKVQWKENDDVMITSTDSLELKQDKPSHDDSTDSLDQKTTAPDIMTTSIDSIELQAQKNAKDTNIMTDSIEMRDEKSNMISSDSLELAQATSSGNNLLLTDSIDEDGSRIGAYDCSSSSTGKDFSSSVKEDPSDLHHEVVAEYMAESIVSLDPTSSTATHATCHYETDSVFSGSFTSGGSNTMVSSTDTIDPTYTRETVDVAAAVRKVWFDEAASGQQNFSTEYTEDNFKPYVTEVIEPAEDDEYSHTIHRKVELPPEVRKVTFTGAGANQQLEQFIRDFNEGEDIQESEEVDADGNIHVTKVVQKRFIVKDGSDRPMTNEEIEDYFKQLQQSSSESTSGSTVTSHGVITKTVTDAQGQKTTFTQQFDFPSSQLTKRAAGVDESYLTKTDGASSSSRAQALRKRSLRYDISVDEQAEVDPREHDWRFKLPRHGETDETDETNKTSQRSDSEQKEKGQQGSKQ